jgi:uncharacterized protein YjbI with pentapeptide repeats
MTNLYRLVSLCCLCINQMVVAKVEVENKAGGAFVSHMEAEAIVRQSPMATERESKDLLSDLNTPKITLKRLNLQGVDFSDYTSIQLKNLNLRGANLKNCSFRGAQLRGIIFTDANLQGADFTGARLTNCSFKNTNLRRSDFDTSVLKRCNFTGAVMSEAQLRQIDAHLCVFKKAILTGAHMDEAFIRQCNFRSSECEKLSMNGARVSYSSYIGANLKGVTNKNTKCKGCSFLLAKR